MTLVPFEEQSEIVAVDGPDYSVGPYCSRPGCVHTADHAHHIVRRSFLGGDYKWIQYKGQSLKNLTGLCYAHHQEVTDNFSSIRWMEANRTFGWWDGSFFVNFLSSVPEVKDKFQGPAGGEVCPSCNRKLPASKDVAQQEKRERRTWSITVPKDEREDGAEVLDGLLDDLRIFFGHDSSKKVRYFTLVQALALVVQHKHEMVSDG